MSNRLEVRRRIVGDASGRLNQATLKRLEEHNPSKKETKAQRNRDFVGQLSQMQFERSLQRMFNGTATLEDINHVLKHAWEFETRRESFPAGDLEITITTITVDGKDPQKV